MFLPIASAAALTLILLAAGGLVTDVGTWYQNLVKPSWNPPNWIFGPAWTLILSLAAGAGVLAWLEAGNAPEAQAGWSVGQISILVLFGINMVLHFLWSPLFFKFRRPDWALIEMPFLWLSILALMISLAQWSWLCPVLLAPYLLWVSFAMFLNLTIVRLNGPFGITQLEQTD